MIEARALRFKVRQWYAWAPGRETRNSWRRWAGVGECDEVPLPSLPMMLRRRTTPAGSRAASGVLDTGPDSENARYVLASRHGELRRSVDILAAMAVGGNPSPTDFSMAVHHGLTGLLSIHTESRSGHTAVAGPDPFAYGLLEAAACVRETPDQPAILIYCEDSLPDAYAQFSSSDDANLPMVVVLTLAAADVSEDAINFWREADVDIHRGQAEHLSAAPEFVRFLLDGSREGGAFGRRARWRWQRLPC